MSDAFLLLAAGTALVGVVMAAVWRVAVRIANAGIVDIAWSWNFALLALLYAGFGPGWLPRRLVFGGMVALWSLRLGTYLYRRVMGHHPTEDGRYQELRAEWAPHVNWRFFWFFELQAVLNVVLSGPLLVACLNQAPAFHPREAAGLALWVVAIVGESLADHQLDRFRRDARNRGRTCEVGLWRYSRHPNYFFEWLVWVAYFLTASASPFGVFTVYAPLLMLFFLFRVTGIPMTEAQALRSRGESYREYQRTTSVFVPWFR